MRDYYPGINFKNFRKLTQAVQASAQQEMVRISGKPVGVGAYLGAGASWQRYEVSDFGLRSARLWR
jgi:hypothetical protein